MRLPSSPSQYSASDQASLRRALEQADAENLKRDRDIELRPATVAPATANPAQRLIMTDRTTGDRYSIVVDSGVLVLDGPL